MVYEFKHMRRVEFSDTDMAGIMHFSRYFIFMESAEHAFFRSLGFSIHTRIGDRRYGWPRLQVDCRYMRPLRFEDEVEIHLRIREITEKTIRYEVLFHKLNADPPELVARGSLTVICVTHDEEESGMRSVPIPAEIKSILKTAPPQP